MNKYFQVIYEDNHIIIVNKAGGVLVQGDKTGDKTLPDLVKDYLKEKYNKPGAVFCGVVHRLDRPVSGAVILAKTSKGLERMTEVFRKREIQKIYWAVTKNRPREEKGKLVHWLVKNEATNTTKAFTYEEEGSQRAELNYRVLGKLNEHWLTEIELLTGRPHQIRAQFSAINCPIRGDVKYGFAKPNPDGTINLHSRRVHFIHPVKKEPITVIAGVPENPFWEQFLTLDDFQVRDKNLDFTW